MQNETIKCLSSWQDLRQYGIVILTGEACGLSLRYLCDVTADGLHLLRQVLDVDNIILREPWNHSSNAVGCIMLPHNWFNELAALALIWKDKMELVAILDRGVLGMNPSCFEPKDGADFWTNAGRVADIYGKVSRFVRPDAKSVEGRNQHVMTGRVH